MAQKVYWKGLELVFRQAYRYGTRWDSKLAISLSPTQYACFRDVIVALASCLAILPQNPPVD